LHERAVQNAFSIAGASYATWNEGSSSAGSHKRLQTGQKEKKMNIKKILTAAAAVAVLSVTGVTTASAASWNDGARYGVTDNRDVNRYGSDDRFDNSGYGDWNGRGYHRGHFANRHLIFAALRLHHIRYVGEPFFVRGHYVVRSFDRFGRVAFVEINPYTGRIIGYVRL
jgi:hypothetical protein